LLILIFYIDNIIAAYAPKHQGRIDDFESKFISRYELRKLGEAKHFLGIQIIRNRS